MTLLGFILQIGTAAYMVYLGYTVQYQDYYIFLAAPLVMMLGQWMRRLSSRSNTRRHSKSFFQIIGDLISGYIVGLVAVAVFFAIGYATMHVLDKRPPPGTGAM